MLVEERGPILVEESGPGGGAAGGISSWSSTSSWSFAAWRQEARQEAEQLMQRLARTVYDETGVIPIFYLKEGSPRDELLALLTDDPSISILVLAAGTGPDGPGPLVSFLASKAMAKLRVPVTIVPGNLTHAQLDAIS